MKKFNVEIDLGRVIDENIPLLFSPKFDTEEEAIKWYKSLELENNDLDIILIEWEDSKMLDSYLLN